MGSDDQGLLCALFKSVARVQWIRPLMNPTGAGHWLQALLSQEGLSQSLL